MAVSVTSLPTNKPGNLTLKRGSDTNMELKWDLSVSKPEWQDITWVFQASKNMSESYREVRGGSNHTTADKLWIRDLGVDSRSFTQPYDRTKYHPVVLGRYLKSVTANLILSPTTSAAKAKHPIESNRHAAITYNFQLPDPPEWGDEASMSSDTGNVSCSLKTASDDHEKEYYDTYYCVTRQDNFTSTYKDETVVEKWKTTTDRSLTVTTNRTSESKSLTNGQWMRVKFKAYSRGLRGNSSTIIRDYVIAHPPKATITSVAVSDVNDANGIITVLFNTNEVEHSPVDTVKLQRLSDTTIGTETAASNSNDWEDVDDAVDDARCTGLTDIVGNARPSRDKHVWYRVVTTRGIYSKYSVPVKVPELERSSSPVTDDTVTISSVTSGDDGESLIVVFGWSNDDSNGTEITWSEKVDAWQSTDQPSSYNVPDSWKDETSQVTGKDNSAKLVIRGLSEGLQYYIKARRYLDTGDTMEYGEGYCTPVSNQYPAKPTSKPTDVTLKAPAYVKRGNGISVTWTYGGVSDQTKWVLYKNVDDNGTVVKTVLASGEDANGVAVVSAEQIGDESQITMSVSITTGGDWSESDAKTVMIADPPSLDLITPGELTDQPMSFYVCTNSSNANLIAKIRSKGVFNGTPDGETVQMNGDVVWGEKVTPSWVFVDDLYYAVVTLPSGVPFINTVDYELFVSVEDPVTGFVSEDVSRRFTVDWDHVASPPAQGTVVSGVSDLKSARISPQKPSDWEDGDVYDIYRVSSDSLAKIVEGGVYGYDVVDRYAPFGKNVSLVYRIVNRTKNGSLSWVDVEYYLYGYQLRFDWDNGAIELPYNITVNDSYSKNYEAHTHIDGSKSGHWNLGVSKTASFSTKIPRLEDRALVRAVRELAKYPGPVFVRTPDGSAFPANVVVKGLDSSYNDLLVGVSIDVEELTCGKSFGVSPDDFILVEQPVETVSATYERRQVLYWGDTPPSQGDVFVLSETPAETDFKVDVLTSYDNYCDATTLSTTVGGNSVVVTAEPDLPIGTGVVYLVEAFYNISQAEG